MQFYERQNTFGLMNTGFSVVNSYAASILPPTTACKSFRDVPISAVLANLLGSSKTTFIFSGTVSFASKSTPVKLSASRIYSPSFHACDTICCACF